MKIRSQAAPTTFMVIYPPTKPQVRKSRQHIPTRKRKLRSPGTNSKTVGLITLELFLKKKHVPGALIRGGWRGTS